MNTNESIVTMTYNLGQPEINSPDSCWSENFIRRSSEDLLSNPKNPAEEAFQSLVSTFSDLLKAKLNSIISPRTSCISFSDSVNQLASSLPNFISSLSVIPPYETSESEDSPEVLPSNISVPQIVISPTEIKEHAGENIQISVLKSSFSQEISLKPVEDSSSKSEGDLDEDSAESSTFRRVLQIFRKNGRSVHELYTCIDINRDGKITASEVRAELLRYDSSFTKEEAEEVFKILDGDKDGYVSEDDMVKRMKFIIEKAKNEENDPLSCLIVSKPLDPDCIHGNISISLLKVSGFKPGSRSIRFRVKDVLEFLTPEFNENVLTYNFKCDFLIENKTPATLPPTVEIYLLNKNTVEGHSSLNWTKSNAITTEFSFKQKLDLKTSLGQARGSIQLQVSWIPIFPKFLSQSELDRLDRLKKRAEAYQAQLERRNKMMRSITHKLTDELPALSEEDSYLEEAKEEVLRGQEAKRMSFMINVCKKSIETLHSPKQVLPRSPTNKVNMDFLSVRSVQKSFTTIERPKTPSVMKLKVESPSVSRMLTPTKSIRKNSVQFYP